MIDFYFQIVSLSEGENLLNRDILRESFFFLVLSKFRKKIPNIFSIKLRLRRNDLLGAGNRKQTPKEAKVFAKKGNFFLKYIYTQKSNISGKNIEEKKGDIEKIEGYGELYKRRWYCAKI